MPINVILPIIIEGDFLKLGFTSTPETRAYRIELENLKEEKQIIYTTRNGFDYAEQSELASSQGFDSVTPQALISSRIISGENRPECYRTPLSRIFRREDKTYPVEYSENEYIVNCTKMPYIIKQLLPLTSSSNHNRYFDLIILVNLLSSLESKKEVFTSKELSISIEEMKRMISSYIQTLEITDERKYYRPKKLCLQAEEEVENFYNIDIVSGDMHNVPMESEQDRRLLETLIREGYIKYYKINDKGGVEFLNYTENELALAKSNGIILENKLPFLKPVLVKKLHI
ncbi:MAG: hypothetical protein PHD02_00525 [Bacilli bacterium]|nr:hypothetical protein [Bacilli bacterium]